MNICFFNHFHNGDVLSTKELVREFMHKIPAQYFYAHNKHPKNLIDVPNLKHINVPAGLPTSIKVAWDNETIYINTWLGAYWSNENCPFGMEIDIQDMLSYGITWKAYTKAFEYVIKVIDKLLGIKYDLQEKLELYAHRIDYSAFNCQRVDKFVSGIDKKDLVMVSNGYVEAGQTLINNDMSSWLNYIAKEFPNKKLICTRKFHATSENILFTDDIIGDRSGHDMNEISYLSTFVDTIIGRNSGPFIFMHTYDNLQDKNKKFLAFGDVIGNCLPTYLKFNSEFTFVKDESESIVLESIYSALEN